MERSISNINSIDDVKNINFSKIQIYNHFYSGDKDTMIEAYNDVMSINGVDGDYYSHSHHQINNYSSLYKKDIDDRFNAIVDFGKKQIEFLTKVSEYLDDLKDEEIKFLPVREKRDYLIGTLLK